MGISKPIVSEIAYRTYAINEFGMATAFILWGNERGLAIDAGCGMYNLKEIMDELCPVPYEVAISHGHGDHIGSFNRWEHVWLHPADWDSVSLELLEENTARLKEYPAMMASFGSFDAYDISSEQIRYPQTLPKLLPLEDGQVFDLGDRKITVLHTPGHTPGEVVFVDPTARILFSGDACNPNLGIRSTSVNTALKGILKIKAHAQEFDRNFNSHIGYGNATVNMAMPASCVDDCIHIMTGLLDGTIQPQHAPSPFRPDGPPAYWVKYGAVQLSIDPERMIDAGEKPALVK